MEKKLSYEDGRKLFVKKLYKLMNERNLSCQYLSSKMKKNDGYINRNINGKKDPSFEVLFDIASALAVLQAFALHCRYKIDGSFLHFLLQRVLFYVIMYS